MSTLNLGNFSCIYFPNSYHPHPPAPPPSAIRSPQQQSSLTPMAPHVFELMLQQAAEQGPWPEAPSGNGRRRNRNRTKRKKALAAAAARRAARDSALCLLASRCMQGGDVAKDPARSLAEKEIGVASSPTSSSMAAEPPSPGKGKRLKAQAAGERHEGRYWQPLWDQARACIARMGVGKVPADGGSGEGAGDGTSGQGPGQVSTAQVLACCHHSLGIRGVMTPSNPAMRCS